MCTTSVQWQRKVAVKAFHQAYYYSQDSPSFDVQPTSWPIPVLIERLRPLICFSSGGRVIQLHSNVETPIDPWSLEMDRLNVRPRGNDSPLWPTAAIATHFRRIARFLPRRKSTGDLPLATRRAYCHYPHDWNVIASCQYENQLQRGNNVVLARLY